MRNRYFNMSFVLFTGGIGKRGPGGGTFSVLTDKEALMTCWGIEVWREISWVLPKHSWECDPINLLAGDARARGQRLSFLNQGADAGSVVIFFCGELEHQGSAHPVTWGEISRAQRALHCLHLNQSQWGPCYLASFMSLEELKPTKNIYMCVCVCMLSSETYLSCRCSF